MGTSSGLTGALIWNGTPEKRMGAFESTEDRIGAERWDLGMSGEVSRGCASGIGMIVCGPSRGGKCETRGVLGGGRESENSEASVLS